MRFQLVLQWPASLIKDYDAMIEVEDVLCEKLSGNEDVDGHDAGSGEMNIFIQTNDPEGTFQRVKSILGTQDFWVNARIAYRKKGKNDYTILWPKGLTSFEVS